MHTNDMLTGWCLCVCADLETHFINRHSSHLIRLDQAPQAKTTCACERVTFSDIAEVIVMLSIYIVISIHTKMSHFQPNCCMKFFISRCFSATVYPTGPLHAWYNTTQQALSTHPYSIASSPSIPILDGKSKNRLISPGRGETRLNSCVCEAYEGRYSTDNSSSPRACFLESIERLKHP